MRTIKKIHAIDELLLRPYFTAKESRELGVHPALLGYYLRTGKLNRLSRGVYRSSQYEGPAENFQWEDLIEAVYSVPGGVVCLISALAVYDITDEIPRKHWIAIRHRTSFKKRKTMRVMRFRNLELGKSEIEIGGVRIPIFDMERTIVDAFRLLSIETAIKALKRALAKNGCKLDLRKLQSYAKQLRINITPYIQMGTTA